MSPHERHLTVHTLAPLLLLAAVGVVIFAQVWNVVPIAGAIALAGWGTALALTPRRGRFALALVVYGPLVLLAIAAQLDAATGSLGRQFIAAMDCGAAAALMVQLGRRAW